MGDLIAELKSRDPSVVCAAMEALEMVNPDAIKQNIVSLLLNNSISVRSRATRAMCRWDQTEAIRYLAAMLFSKNKNERDATLNNSLFFPFKQIEGVLLKFLTVENEPELVKKAGLVFMANPDKSTAFRLYEAQQATRNLRADLINGILMGVLTSLFQAKLETDEPAVQLKKIREEYINRKTKIYINHFSSLLGSEEPDIRLKAAIKLCELIKNNITDVNFILLEYLKTESDEEVAKKVRRYLDSVTAKASSDNIESANTPEERKKIYASINKDNFSKYIGLLLPVLKTLDATEQVIILRFIQEYGDKSLSNNVIKCLESNSPEVIQASIEVLYKIDSEALQPHLPTLIKSDSDQVKLAAINAFALFDKKQTLTILGQMMTSVKVAQRKNALFCLENLDFASVSDILITALKQERNKEIRQELYDVLYDNGNDEIFYEIYFYFMSANKNEKAEIQSFLNKLSDKLCLKSIGKKSSDYWDTAKARWDEENAMVAQREAYRLENIESLRNDDNNWQEKIELIKFATVCHSFGLLLTILIWFGYMAPNSVYNKMNAEKIKEHQKKKKEIEELYKKKESFPKDIITVKGRIIEVSKQHGQAMLEDDSGKRYMLTFNDDNKIPELDQDFTAQILIEDCENSIYFAKVVSVL